MTSVAVPLASQFDASLPQVRRDADRLMLPACVVGALVAIAIGWHYNQVTLAAGFAGALMTASFALFVFLRGTWVSSLTFPVMLAGFVALHIQLSGGNVQYHFGAFVMLAFLLAYRHWLPVLAGAGALAVHHVLFDRLQALGFPVFCQPQADFFGILIHAGYVVVEAAFGMVVAVHMRRDALLSAELEFITRQLSARPGQISFSGLQSTSTTAAGQRLLDILGTVRKATVVARDSALYVNTSSTEIAMGSEDLSQRTEEAAAGLQRTASAVEELTATVSATANRAAEASQLAETAARKAVDGEKTAKILSERMQGVAESSRKVTDIVGLIDSIAFQTNILALNAAVEAARAGEQGRGFSVVASEVRLLAKRSAEAAGDIKKLIADSTSQVEDGVSATEQTRRALDGILVEVRSVHEILADVARAASEQRQGIADVNESLATLDKATQQNAALVEQSAAAAASLREQASHLDKAMASFDLESTASTAVSS